VAGGSDYPLELMRIGKLLDEMEVLVGQLKANGRL